MESILSPSPTVSGIQVDAVVREALDALHQVVPYDLATVMELDGDELTVRVARGRLSDHPEVRNHRLNLEHYPSLRKVLEEGRARAFVEHDHKDGDGDPFDGVLDLPHGHLCMVSPLRSHEAPIGLITLDQAECGEYPDAAVKLADVFGKLLALVLEYGEQSVRLDSLRQRLEEQNRALREEVGKSDACDWLEASVSPAMQHVVRLAKQVAVTDAPVLITGETGTGKDVLANAIHAWGARADGPLVSVNCAALPSGLIESELFGHVKGAFSGATANRIGRFQAANKGTLFLDEVGELPPDMQAKLLRVLQEGTFEPVGSDKTVSVDVRIVAATNRDLEAAIAEKSFREDLFYRLAVFPIRLPPLRARKEDIPVIAEGVLERLFRRTRRGGPWTLSASGIERLQSRDWAGNVRELVNVLERATILADGQRLDLPEVRPDASPRPTQFETLTELERRHIERVLVHTGGKLYGPGGAAEILGLNPSTLASRMRKHGLGGARDYKR